MLQNGDSDLVDHIDLTEGWGTNDSILFDTALDPEEDGATISLNEFSELWIKRSVTIDATSLPSGITIVVNNSRVFRITEATGNDIISEVALVGLTMTGGDTYDDGGGVYFLTNRAGITLSIEDCTIIGNHANDNGGGIYVFATTADFQFNLFDTTITNNLSPTGEGLYSDQVTDFTTTLNHTIVSGNEDGSGDPPSTDPNNIAGSIEADSSYNLISEGPANHDINGNPNAGFPTTGPGNIDDTDNGPGLIDLGFYRGPTQRTYQSRLAR